MFKNITDISKQILTIMCVLSLFACLVSGIFLGVTPTWFGFILGILVGTLLSVYRLIFMEKALLKSIDLGERGANNYVRVQFFVRYIVTAVVLIVVAINHPTINLFGAGIGLINMQLAAYLSGLIYK